MPAKSKPAAVAALRVSETAATTHSHAAVPLSAEAAATVTRIRAEFERDAGKRKSSIDPEVLAMKFEALRLALQVAHLKPHAPDRLPAYQALYLEAFRMFEDATRDLNTAVPTQRRYSSKTRAYAKSTCFPVFAEVRNRGGERLDHTPGSDDLRTLLGVSGSVTAEAPQDILRGMETQLAASSDPKWIPMMEAEDLFPAVWAEQLAPLIKTLRDLIHEGVSNEVLRADALEAQQAALLLLDITLSRAASFLATWAGGEVAKALEDEVPRKHQKAAGMTEEEEKAAAEKVAVEKAAAEKAAAEAKAEKAAAGATS